MLAGLPRLVAFERWPKGKATLEALHQDAMRLSDTANLVAVCNEPLIYNRIFRDKLHDRPYTQANAQAFINFATAGWDKQSHFVYVIRNKGSAIVGAIDIKSSELAGAEIGYWLSTLHQGYMTNAVLTLCKIAKKAGFKALYARIAPDNQRSAQVVLRCGFKKTGKIEKYGKFFDKYVRTL